MGAAAAWPSSASERVLKDVASDQETAGLQVSLTIDRDTASRLGISPQLIDDTLYDAFGQRQVSTIFTQLNLYRVILEVKPEQARTAAALDKHLRAHADRRARAAQRDRARGDDDRAAGRSTTRGSSRR